jgi:hypothetical protein
MHALRAAHRKTKEIGFGLRIFRLRRTQPGCVRQVTVTSEYYTRDPFVKQERKFSSTALKGQVRNNFWLPTPTNLKPPVAPA